MPGVSMLYTYVCMLHVYSVREDCLYQLLRRYKYSQCCQITSCFNCTKHSVGVNDSRSYIRKHWLLTDQIQEQFMFLYKGRLFKKYFKNVITIKNHIFLTERSCTNITDHIMTSSTSCIRHETESFLSKEKPRKYREFALSRKLYSNSQCLQHRDYR